MLRASQILGVLAGLVGLLTTTLYLADVSGGSDPSPVPVILGMLSYVLLVVGIAGGGVAHRYPRWAIRLQGAGLLGALLNLGLLSALMFAVAVFFAWRGRGEIGHADGPR